MPPNPDGEGTSAGAVAATEMVRLAAPDLTAHGDAPPAALVEGSKSPLDNEHEQSGDGTTGGTAVSSSAKGETALPEAYLSYLSALQAAWPDLPDLTITYDKLAYEVSVPRRHHDHIPTIANAIGAKIRSLNVFRDRSKETQLFHPLHPCEGVVRSGELTLVLAPPGHGKSALLKALAGRLVQEGDAVKGQLRWNGLDAKESAAAGQQLSKLCAFVEQGDVQ